MGIIFDIKELQGVLMVSIEGSPDVEDIKQILDRIQTEPGYAHPARLWDFQKSIFNFSQNEIFDIASHAAAGEHQPAKLAILVKEDLSFGVSRMYEVFRNSDLTETNVFRDKTEALAWLRGPKQRALTP